MHMADALISPVVGGAFAAVIVGLGAYAAKKVQSELDEKQLPMMGVLGAFVFAAQMINFAIPGTGSSGHLGGGLLLSILLGPAAGFLTMVAILIIQALFFADGGILALGCNIFNLGFFPCFVVYPLIFRRLMTPNASKTRIFLVSLFGAILSLQLGAFGVVMETKLSGISELPIETFLILMQSIHLAIGVVEGLVTAAIVSFLWQARPELNQPVLPLANFNTKKLWLSFLLGALLVAGVFSWFASSQPDGLEWSMFRTSGHEELAGKSILHQRLDEFQTKFAVLPDYNLKNAQHTEGKYPNVDGGTSLAGLIGAGLTLFLAGLLGIILKFVRKRITCQAK